MNWTHRTLRVRSRHACHHQIAGINIPGKEIPYLRMGSVTRLNARGIHINRPECIINACDKQRTKECLATNKKIPTAPWQNAEDAAKNRKIKTPFVVKHRLGSRGTGVHLIRKVEEWDKFVKEHQGRLNKYIIERYKPYGEEFRLHVSSLGIFYACRKALKKKAPKKDRWRRSDENCVWYSDKNKEHFHKPKNWQEINELCTLALQTTGLDVAGFDVRVSPKTNKWFIVEINSAPAFATITTERYTEHMPKLAQHIRKTRGVEVK